MGDEVSDKLDNNQFWSVFPTLAIWCLAIQILCEINFWESRTFKTAGFAIFLGSELGEFANFQPSKSIQIPKNQNSEPLKLQKWQILHF